MSEKLYRTKKGGLDQRLKAAENVIADYERTLKGNILTNDEIDATMRDLEKIRYWLEEQGELTYDQKVALLNAMRVTGVVYADTLKLFVYRTHLADLDLQVFSMPSARR